MIIDALGVNTKLVCKTSNMDTFPKKKSEENYSVAVFGFKD